VHKQKYINYFSKIQKAPQIKGTFSPGIKRAGAQAPFDMCARACLSFTFRAQDILDEVRRVSVDSTQLLLQKFHKGIVKLIRMKGLKRLNYLT